MSQLLSTLYVSSAVKHFTIPELDTLLEVSRHNNQPAGITGMLLYKDGHFMQALEGSQKAVREVLARIAADPRHGRIVTLTETWANEREFPDWTMGFENLDDPAARQRSGFSEFLNLPFTGREFAEDPSLAKRLLASFKQKAL